MSGIHEPRELPSSGWLTPSGRRSLGGPEAWVATGAEAAESAEPGEWLKNRLDPISISTGTRVCSVIPRGFEAYARVLHPDVGYCPPRVVSALVEILRGHTLDGEHCWACVWEGWGGIGDAFPEIPRLDLPWRRHLMFSVPFSVLVDGVFRGPGAHRIGPSLWWSRDRTWCVATEVDFSWTYVGGAGSCIEEIVADRRLEVFLAAPDDRGDSGSDQVNGVIR